MVSLIVAAGFAMDAPPGSPPAIYYTGLALKILIGAAMYVVLIIFPTILHANEMIHNFEDRIRGGVPWTADLWSLCWHTFATLFFMSLMVIAPVVLLLFAA